MLSFGQQSIDKTFYGKVFYVLLMDFHVKGKRLLNRSDANRVVGIFTRVGRVKVRIEAQVSSRID